MAVPTITSFDVASGNTAGGLLVEVTGTGLSTVTKATFGGTDTAVVGTPTATKAKFRTPKVTSTGVKTATVTNPEGTSGPLNFTYTKPPFGGKRGPNGAVVAPEDVYTQGDSVSSTTKPAVLTYMTGQVQTQGSLGGMNGAIPDWVSQQEKNVVFGHPDNKALQGPNA